MEPTDKWAVADSAAVLGKVLAEIRKAKNMNQKDVADAVGIGVSTWSKIENGESSISVEQLRAAATCLGTTPSKVLALMEDATEKLPEKGIMVTSGAAIAGVAAGVGLAAGTGITSSLVAGGTIASSTAGIIGTALGGPIVPIIITGAVLGKVIGSVVDVSSLWKNKK